MPLSRNAVGELQGELKSLQGLKARLDERIAAINAILTPMDFGQAELAFTGTQTPAPISARLPRKRRQRAVGGGSTGLRAAVMKALQERGPMTARSIAAVLTEQGFQDDARTPLSQRIYNDLYRLASSDDSGIVLENKLFRRVA
jgi:hypothetical protein